MLFIAGLLIKRKSLISKIAILFCFFFQHQFIFAQRYDIVIKGGNVIDPKTSISDVLDIAISSGKIVTIAKGIETKSAEHVINASGMYVVPGLIDIHTHDFYGPHPDRAFCNGTASMIPDSFTFCSGVTTVVDAGSSGWKDFPVFKNKIIDNSRTRVLAFLNIVGSGMRGGGYEQNAGDMDGKKAAMMAQKYRDYIVGFKLAHFKGREWMPVDEAIKAGKIAKLPVMIDFGDNATPLSVKELFLTHMRPKDIFTHCFAELKGRETIVDLDTKKLKPSVWEAKHKGIQFGVGYGEISFAFSQATPAVKAGFYPDFLSTDMHTSLMGNKMKDLPNIMSKFLALGMSIQDIIRTVTWNPAREISHEELGNISAGGIADITILSLINGKFEFYDHTGHKIEGSKKFECNTTIKGGKIVYGIK